VNSDELIVAIELYSVSGIPNCSLSKVIKFNENSEIFSFLLLSKMNVIFDGSSSAFMVIISSLPAHFMILARLVMLRPSVIALSALNPVKPLSYKFKETNATWDESIACIVNPVVLTSILTEVTSSLMASTIFLRMTPCSNLAWNILLWVERDC